LPPFPSPIPQLDGSPQAFHILIAEDDDSLREILADTLQSPERRIRLCRDGSEALQALEKSSFDLILTDLLMAGASGLEVLEAAKRKNPDSVVIIMTGYASLDSAIQAIRGGAYDYIPKPFKIGELEIVVKNAIEKIILIRENRRLLQRLEEIMEEMKKLRQSWYVRNEENQELRLPSSPALSHLDVALRQIPPDYELAKRDAQEKAVEELQRLIRLRKEGHIDDREFSLLKRLLVKKLSD